MSLYQSLNLKDMKQSQNIYKIYSYVIFVFFNQSREGPQKVGKTNIITRFIKDQFTEAHNMTLEGQQSSIVNIDNRKFQILVHDTAGNIFVIDKGQQNLCSMKAMWRGNKDGYIFVYAIDNHESFEQLLKDIETIKQNKLYQNIPIIVVGNKQDLRNMRQVDKRWAQEQIKRFDIKLIEISAKTSPREQIEKIFIELIQMSEMNLFCSQDKYTQVINSKREAKSFWRCCDREDSSDCLII